MQIQCNMGLKPNPHVPRARSLIVCKRAQYHGQRRIRDVSRLANEFDIVVATYQTLGADHRVARPLPLCCDNSDYEFASVDVSTYQDPAQRPRGPPFPYPCCRSVTRYTWHYDRHLPHTVGADDTRARPLCHEISMKYLGLSG